MHYNDIVPLLKKLNHMQKNIMCDIFNSKTLTNNHKLTFFFIFYAKHEYQTMVFSLVINFGSTSERYRIQITKNHIHTRTHILFHKKKQIQEKLMWFTSFMLYNLIFLPFFCIRRLSFTKPPENNNIEDFYLFFICKY